MSQLTNAPRGFIVANEGQALEVMKRKLYDAALVEADGNNTKAAKLLGVSRSHLWKYTNDRSAK